MINIVKEDKYKDKDKDKDNNEKYYNSVDNKNIIECKLNKNIFNPAKNSPINNWQYRLIKRINNLDNYDLSNLDSFKLNVIN